MPVIPVLAAVGTAVGASAGTAAAVGGLVIAGTAAAVGTSVYGANRSAAAAKVAAGQAGAGGTPQPTNAQTVDPATGMSSNTQNAGRAALISTSPSGVQGLDPTGRRRLLGN